MRFIVVVREIGRTSPDYSVEFEAPVLPSIGSYLSIHRPDAEHGHTEDLVVRHIWWRLEHPETSGFASAPEKIGSVVNIQVECDQAIGPHSLDRWRTSLEAARDRGVEVEEFNLSRFSLTEAEMKRV
jgi:hypothetical protein